jgi:hypothetical protein
MSLLATAQGRRPSVREFDGVPSYTENPSIFGPYAHAVLLAL